MKIIQTADLTRKSITELSEDEKSWVYNGLDCCVTHEVNSELTPQLDNTTATTYNFSLALQAPIMEMSLRGLKVDHIQRDKTIKIYKEQVTRLESQLDRIVHEGVGIELNWRSPKQLAWLLYDIMNLPPVRKRNVNGQMVPTTNRDAIEKLSSYFIAKPICSHLLALRDLQKKISFLETDIDSDGRIRCSFNIAGTNTGRLSSAFSEFGTGTNLQNVDRLLRNCFAADKGMKYANLDLEQADSRNLGAMCWNILHAEYGPEYAGAYLDACESGDLHTTVCRMAWQPLEWGTDSKLYRGVADQIAYRDMSYRDLAKRLGHGTNYEGTPPTMARHSKVAVPIIEEFQHAYFKAFPCIKDYHTWVKKCLREQGTITTLLNRKRRFFGRPNDPKIIREAVAYGPQSATADEVDLGLLALFRANFVQLLLQVHDSILFQYPEELEDEVVPKALELMRVPITLVGGRAFHVPVEAKVGWNWGNREENNPDGLIKWRGHDDRKRLNKVEKKWSLWNL